MRTLYALRCSLAICVFTMGLAAGGCGPEVPLEVPPQAPAPPPRTSEAKLVPAGRNIWLEIQGDRRRVVFDAVVCLREGFLEQFLCRKHTKEHEAVLSADVDARELHAALLVTGAKPGSPVQFEPTFRPASGTPIRVLLEYEEQGKKVTIPAQKWVRNATTKKDLAYEWVFAGSQLIPSEEKGRPPFYAANSGDIICVSNFEAAMLDLPISSSRENAELVFEAHTERIPPLDTRVRVILEPDLSSKKPGR